MPLYITNENYLRSLQPCEKLSSFTTLIGLIVDVDVLSFFFYPGNYLLCNVKKPSRSVLSGLKPRGAPEWFQTR